MPVGPVTKGLEEAAVVIKSPLVEAVYGAAKGGVVGGAVGALIGQLSGGSPGKGALLTGLLAAAAFGAGKAAVQDIENKEHEAGLRVHLENLKKREPFFYMPPPRLFRKAVQNVR